MLHSFVTTKANSANVDIVGFLRHDIFLKDFKTLKDLKV